MYLWLISDDDDDDDYIVLYWHLDQPYQDGTQLVWMPVLTTRSSAIAEGLCNVPTVPDIEIVQL